MAMDEKEIASDRQRQGRGHRGVWGDATRSARIERVMIDKRSGRVSYAVLVSAFPGLRHDHYPLPWQSLKYEPRSAAIARAVPKASFAAGQISQ